MMYATIWGFAALAWLGPTSVHSSTVEMDAGGVSVLGNLEVESFSLQDGLSNKKPQNVTDDSLMIYVPALVEWVQDEGGSIHQHIEFRPHEETADVGLFASEFIPKGTDLLTLPKSVLITGGHNDKDARCSRQQTARNLYKELQLGPSKSQYGPYLAYMAHRAATPSKERLPTAMWSKEGQRILEELLVRDRSNDQNEKQHSWDMAIDLPPQNASRGSLSELLEDCDDHNEAHHDELYYHYKLHAFLQYHKLSWGNNDNLMPIYDMLKHRNGKFVNTMYQEVVGEDGEISIVLRSSRNIPKDEELFGSHYQHLDEDHYGTPEIFRDYGFVEDYPQRFVFHDTDVAFVLEQVQESEEDNNSTSKTNELRVKWISGRPYDEDIALLDKQLDRLTDFFFEARRSEMARLPEIEQRLLRRYHEALVDALATAIGAYDDKDTCILAEGPCLTYDSLQETPDTLNYRAHTCNTEKTLQFTDYADIETHQNPYQKTTFFHNAGTKDTCFDLEGTVQVCDSYRPDYHEPAVHYPARYLDKLERALFVGGGDSMLLHELLKYESIQKVVGLELDQHVTRLSFKHFGTQPHWDNEKVEWWYGDASKTLGLLPREYFGSFDLVIVDLSETVMSFRVTSNVDIFGALALLLKPKGILVKNEVMYLEKFSSMFDYTVQAIVNNAPVVCHQVMVYGSYENDFLEQKLKEVDVNTLLLQNREDLLSPYGVWHDYRKNSTRLHPTCKDTDSDNSATKASLEAQTNSPGIIMIVDVEEASGVAVSPNLLKNLLTTALSNLGFTVVAGGMATEAEDENGEKTSMISLALEEGYIMARAWPNKEFCALDIHLWSSFDKQDELRKTLITSLGGRPSDSTSSAYRVVAGGIFGAKKWEDEDQKRGPKVSSEICDTDLEARPAAETQPATAIPDEAITILSETLSLVNDTDITVAVVCGAESESCNSLEEAYNHDKVGKTVPIWTCPNLKHFDAETEFGLEIMQQCYRLVSQQLKDAPPLRAMVLDPTVPYAMGQLLAKLFLEDSDEKAIPKHSLIGKDFMIATTAALHDDDTRIPWRRALMDRFRHDIIVKDPVFRAQVLFQTKDSDSNNLELDITSSGDEDFVARLEDALGRLENKTGVVADVRTIQGGLFRHQDDHNPQIFGDSDYDQTSGLEQWMSQEPLGFQTLFQLEGPRREWTDYIRKGDRIEVYEAKDDLWKPGHMVKRLSNAKGLKLYDVKLEDGGKMARRLQAKHLRPVEGDGPILTPSQLEDALVHALDAIVEKKEHDDKDTNSYHWRRFSIGEGSVWVALWKGGSVTVLWDGREHIGVNLFTYKESTGLATLFIEEFAKKPSSYWQTYLRDKQPRGMGRVVNFGDDLDVNEETGERERPHWAPTAADFYHKSVRTSQPSSKDRRRRSQGRMFLKQK